MAITGQTPMNLNTVLDQELQGFSESVDKVVSTATAANPANIMLIKNVRNRLSFTFASSKSVQIKVLGSTDRTADATDATKTGKFANLLIDPEIITCNNEAFYEVWNTALYAILIQAYPSTGVSGEVKASSYARMRSGT